MKVPFYESSIYESSKASFWGAKVSESGWLSQGALGGGTRGGGHRVRVRWVAWLLHVARWMIALLCVGGGQGYKTESIVYRPPVRARSSISRCLASAAAPT